MSTWINGAALGKILGVGLLAGAGLPALFAFGLKVISPRGEDEIVLSGGAVTRAVQSKANPAALGVGVLCFAVVLAAIGYGIYIIVNG
ncbi:MAG TPA: hypothetical protein VHX15_06510 [Frankiaceae bacterium]|jgi:hypothetical protein|nr:hypothetical protein [Frankiaceae bacterium]